MQNLLRRKLSGLLDGLVRFTQRLVQTESISLHETRAVEQVVQEMNRLPFDKVLEDDFGNAVGIVYGTGRGPTMLLASHVDTVAPYSESSWRGSPWSGRLIDGKLTGLGASDCKSGVAAQVYAAALLKASLLPLRGNLVVSATVAEKNGLSLGMRGLVGVTLRQLGLVPTYAILGEPTDLGLYYGHDGWAEVELTIRSASPDRVLDAAQDVFTGLRHQAPVSGLEELFVHEPSFGDRQGLPEVTLTVEKRLRPDDTQERLVDDLRRQTSLLTRRAGEIEVEVAIREMSEHLASGIACPVKRVASAWNTDPLDPLVLGARQALAAVDDVVRVGRWKLDRLGMGTAGGVLSGEFHIPTIGFGPGGEKQAHTCNEWVEMKAVVECARKTATIVHELIGVPVFGWATDEP